MSTNPGDHFPYNQCFPYPYLPYLPPLAPPLPHPRHRDVSVKKGWLEDMKYFLLEVIDGEDDIPTRECYQKWVDEIDFMIRYVE